MEAITPDNYFKLGKYLAHTGKNSFIVEKKTRDEAIKNLETFLSTNPSTEMIKLWKGLFYCFWMSDKPLIQQELATKLSSFTHLFSKDDSIKYLEGFWEIMGKEWPQIDRYRLNKYYFLLRQMHLQTLNLVETRQVDLVNMYRNLLTTLPDSLKYHTLEALFDEAQKAQKKSIQPFMVLCIDILRTSTHQQLWHRVTEILKNMTNEWIEFYSTCDLESFISCVYELVNDPTAAYSNKDKLIAFCETWTDIVPFEAKKETKLPTKLYGDFKIIKEKPRKKRVIEQVPINVQDIQEPEEMEEIPDQVAEVPKKKKKKLNSSDTFVQAEQVTQEVAQPIPKKKKKKKTVIEQVPEVEPEMESEMEPELLEESHQSIKKKNVVFNQKVFIKPFFKRKPIGNKKPLPGPMNPIKSLLKRRLKLNKK